MSNTVIMPASTRRARLRIPVRRHDRPAGWTGGGGRIRVGGQALPDGVLMRAGRGWAIARADGSVVSGELPAGRLADVPVVRVLVALGRGVRLGMGSRLHRRTTGRLRVAAALVAAQLAVMGADRLLGRSAVPLLVSVVVGLVTAVAVFRLATPRSLWRYHGAEHKVVAAYEAGVDIHDVGIVARFSRVHDRCGTNLLVGVAALSLVTGGLPWFAQVPAVLTGIGLVVEVFGWAGRRPAGRVSRLVLVPGRLLQRLVTTAEPDPRMLAVAGRALGAALDRHRIATGVTTVAVTAPTVPDRLPIAV